MKKLIAVIIAAVMLLSLCGCSAFVQGFVDGYNDAMAVQSADNEAEETEAEEIEATIQAETAVPEEEKEISRGTISEDVYTSDSLGLSFEKPGSWRWYSDEELAQLMGLTMDELNVSNLEKVLIDNASVYDMMVVDETTGTNVIVGYENVMMTAGVRLSAESYADVLSNNLKAMQIGEELSRSYAYLGGIEHLKLEVGYTDQDTAMTQVYYIREMGDYINFIIITVSSGYEVEDIEAMFS